MKTTIERIRELREDNDLKQLELAALLGTTQQQYSRYETGESELSLRGLALLADRYNVSADYLMTRTESKIGVDATNKTIVDNVTVGTLLTDLMALDENGRRAVLEYLYLQKLKHKYGKQSLQCRGCE